MKRALLIGAAVATLSYAALQATPSVRDPLGQNSGDVEEPDAADPAPDETPAPKPKPQAKPAAEPAKATTQATVDPDQTGPQMPALAASPPPVERPSFLTPSKFALPAPPPGKATPMADRVAVIGLLNKRNGLWRDIIMKPGEARRIGDVVVRLRACERTAPWEDEQLTGAFVQLIVNDTDKKWRRYFSGWLFRESPSLNVVEHPIYDVWTKECRMRYADVGANTSVVRGDAPQERKGEGEEE